MLHNVRTMAQPPTRPSGPFRPTRLGQWEVIAKIAGGGMSAVYLGRRVGDEAASFDTPKVVALKIVRHDVRDDRLLKMFLEEGKLIARLVHPNIVRTLEVGGDAEQDFIAMELMLGKTFAAIHDTMAQRGVRLNSDLAAWTAARIADALHYAHELADENGVPLQLVHRDVNPANVFATFNGEVKLFDFGLAKATAGEASGSQLLAGKLSYLSPEQIMQLPLDRRSDIFSLGTTLWELLTGKRLFRRDSDIDTVRAVQLGPIPDPRQIAPEIPEELARITKTALERNREHRYPSGAYLARELDAYVFMRTSPNDVAARLAQLVDTLFPGEQKRQSGWLKPAISGSISRASGPTSLRPGTSGPLSSGAQSGAVSSNPGPLTTRPRRSMSPPEVTAVMPGAPPKPAAATAQISKMPEPATVTSEEGIPSAAFGSATGIAVAPPVPFPPDGDFSSTVSDLSSSALSPLDPMDALDQLETGSSPSLPGPLTPREGIPVAPPSNPGSSPGSLPPSTARSLPPITPREGPITSPSSGAPNTARSGWPVSANSRLSPSVPPPPQRSRQPAASPTPRGPSMPPPPVVTESMVPPPQSRTDIERPFIPPPAKTPGTAPATSTAPAAGATKPPVSLPTGGPLSVGRGRLPRAPIPLPSSKKSVVPPAASSSAAVGKIAAASGSSRKAITDPPDSDTQVDIPAPPNKNDPKKR